MIEFEEIVNTHTHTHCSGNRADDECILFVAKLLMENVNFHDTGMVL